jgi:hypothetical protein
MLFTERNGRMTRFAALTAAAMGLVATTSSRGQVQSMTESQKLLTSDGQPSDKFGIAIDREGDTLIIGAPQHYTNSLPGSFYVFTRDAAGIWIEQQRVMSQFKAGSAEFGDLFGDEIAIEGDSLLVGAPFTEIDGVMLVGTVYAFAPDDDGLWIQQQILLPSDLNITRFGEHMAISGDTAIITSQERAFIFSRDAAGTWSQQGELQNIGLDLIGPVAFDGETIVLATGEVPLGEMHAVVFTSSGGQWVKSASISTSASGVLNSVPDICIGGGDQIAMGVIDAAGPDVALVLHQAESGTWTEQTTIDPDSLSNDSFGVDLALAGDLLLVGASHVDPTGQVYVFQQSAAEQWTHTAMLVPSDSYELVQNFGDEISFQDGLPVVGSWAHHENGLYSGAAWVFDEIEAPVAGDLTGDGVVGPGDLAELLAQWGKCPPPDEGNCTADIAPQPDGDGSVGPADLAELLANWG